MFLDASLVGGLVGRLVGAKVGGHTVRARYTATVSSKLQLCAHLPYYSRKYPSSLNATRGYTYIAICYKPLANLARTISQVPGGKRVKLSVCAYSAMYEASQIFYLCWLKIMFLWSVIFFIFVHYHFFGFFPLRNFLVGCYDFWHFFCYFKYIGTVIFFIVTIYFKV